MPEDRLVAAMDDLTASGLVFRQGSPPDATYAFKHALVRDAAYETLLRGERRRLHARVVQALEQHFSEQAAAQPELMAVHCANAGLLAQAAAHRLNAGNQAMARSAVKEAVAQFSTGLETLAPLVASRERSRLELELQIGLGSALTTAKGFAAEDTGRAYARARDLCHDLDEATRIFPVLWGLTVFQHQPRRNAVEY
jgi:predicted ATPase